jgi:hypothetical protein
LYSKGGKFLRRYLPELFDLIHQHSPATAAR